MCCAIRLCMLRAAKQPSQFLGPFHQVGHCVLGWWKVFSYRFLTEKCNLISRPLKNLGIKDVLFAQLLLSSRLQLKIKCRKRTVPWWASFYQNLCWEMRSLQFWQNASESCRKSTMGLYSMSSWSRLYCLQILNRCDTVSLSVCRRSITSQSYLCPVEAQDALCEWISPSLRWASLPDLIN
jgi:hypothetical protein